MEAARGTISKRNRIERGRGHTGGHRKVATQKKRQQQKRGRGPTHKTRNGFVVVDCCCGCVTRPKGLEATNWMKGSRINAFFSQHKKRGAVDMLMSLHTDTHKGACRWMGDGPMNKRRVNRRRVLDAVDYSWTNSSFAYNALTGCPCNTHCNTHASNEIAENRRRRRARRTAPERRLRRTAENRPGGRGGGLFFNCGSLATIQIFV